MHFWLCINTTGIVTLHDYVVIPLYLLKLGGNDLEGLCLINKLHALLRMRLRLLGILTVGNERLLIDIHPV